MARVIYKTINLITEEWYIGQDSNNIPGYLGGGLILKRAIRKYGRNNFKKIILETLPADATKEDLNCAEIKWISQSGAVGDISSYNIALGGSAISTNPETGKKISERLKGNMNGNGPRPHCAGENWKGKRGPEHHLHGKPSVKRGIAANYEQRLANSVAHGSKPFLMYAKDGTLIGEYAIIADCARQYGLWDTCISRCLRGKAKTHSGYTFVYKEPECQ